jgi:hypothetical protein
VTAATVSAAAAAAYMMRPHLRQLILPKLDSAYPLGVLQDIEMRNIVALGETLVVPEYTPPVDFFHDFVNAQTRSQPGFLKEYQRAAALLNATSADLFGQGAQLQFADLPAPRRDKVLQTQLWQYTGSDRIVPKVEKLAASRDVLALRIYVVSPLIEHYYRSPYGWAIVGYESFPGRPPHDPRAYTRPLSDKGVAS